MEEERKNNIKATTIRIVAVLLIVAVGVGYFINKNFKTLSGPKTRASVSLAVTGLYPANNTVIDAGIQVVSWSSFADAVQYSLSINKGAGTCDVEPRDSSDICSELVKADTAGRGAVYSKMNFIAGNTYTIKVLAFTKDDTGNLVPSLPAISTVSVVAPGITNLQPSGVFAYPVNGTPVISWNAVPGAFTYKIYGTNHLNANEGPLGACAVVANFNSQEHADYDICASIAAPILTYTPPDKQKITAKQYVIRVDAYDSAGKAMIDPTTNKIISAVNYITVVVTPPPESLVFTPVAPAVGPVVTYTGGSDPINVPAGYNKITWTKPATGTITGYFLRIVDLTLGSVPTTGVKVGCDSRGALKLPFSSDAPWCKTFSGSTVLFFNYNFLSNHKYKVELYNYVGVATVYKAPPYERIKGLSDPINVEINTNEFTYTPPAPVKLSFTPVLPAIGPTVMPSQDGQNIPLIPAGYSSIKWLKPTGLFTGYSLSINDVTNVAPDAPQPDACINGKSTRANDTDDECVGVPAATLSFAKHNFLDNHIYTIKMYAHIVTRDNISKTLLGSGTVKASFVPPPTGSLTFTSIVPALVSPPVVATNSSMYSISAGKNKITWMAVKNVSGYRVSINDITNILTPPIASLSATPTPLEPTLDLIHSSAPAELQPAPIEPPPIIDACINTPAVGSKDKCISTVTLFDQSYNFLAGHTYSVKLHTYIGQTINQSSTYISATVAAKPLVVSSLPSLSFKPLAPAIGAAVVALPMQINTIPAGKNSITWTKPVGGFTGYLLSINLTEGQPYTDTCSEIPTRAPIGGTAVVGVTVAAGAKGACIYVPAATTLSYVAGYNFIGGKSYTIKLTPFIIDSTNISSTPSISVDVNVNPLLAPLAITGPASSVLPGTQTITWPMVAGVTGYRISIRDITTLAAGETAADACAGIGNGGICKFTTTNTPSLAYVFTTKKKYRIKIYSYIVTTDNMSVASPATDVTVQ